MSPADATAAKAPRKLTTESATRLRQRKRFFMAGWWKEGGEPILGKFRQVPGFSSAECHSQPARQFSQTPIHRRRDCATSRLAPGQMTTRGGRGILGGRAKITQHCQ